MSVVVECIGLVVKASSIIKSIIDRLHQLKLSEDIARKIIEKLEYLQMTIKRVEPHLKKVDDAGELEQFVAHLQQAYQSCVYILETSRIIRFISVSSIISMEHSIEVAIDRASSKLQLFITSNHLSLFCGVADYQNQVLGNISATLRTNTRAGIYSIEDKSVTPPSAPHGLTIQENKDKLSLSWEPSKGIVGKYEVCYDEHNECIVAVGMTTTVTLESPRVQPGNIYAMKVRGINKGGIGEWSDVVIGQITKPFPLKPEILNLLCRSTMVVVTVKVAEAICSTESPVTCVEVSYAITCTPDTQLQFTTCKFEIQPGDDTFTVSGLQPDSRYTFRVKTQNAEGWSKPSALIEGDTLSLPLLPAKPSPPVIKVCAPTKVKLMAKVPEDTCSIKSPIIAWKVCGYSESYEEIYQHYAQDELDFMQDFNNLYVVNLNPNQQYTLQLLAKNENSWSEPSEEFKVHIAAPSPPENVRVSRKRTHSVIKIRWNAPASIVVAHYEIAKTTRRGNYDEKPTMIPAIKFSATFTKLKQKTQ